MHPVRLDALHGAPGGRRRRGPWRSLDDEAFATQEWGAWFNTQRLPAPLEHVPPAEYEARYHTPRPPVPRAWDSTGPAATKPGAAQRGVVG